jgi:hypothetical protein
MAEKKPATARAERVEIGFNGGQVIAARLESKQLDDLKKAAAAGEGWHEVTTEDGLVSINLAQLDFIRSDSPDQRVGFGN